MPTSIFTTTTPSKDSSTIINVQLNLLKVAYEQDDKRLVIRVLQHLPQLRRQLTSSIILPFLKCSNSPLALDLVQLLNDDKAPTTTVATTATTTMITNEKVVISPFGEAYLLFLTSVFLVDQKKMMEAEKVLWEVIRGIESLNRRLLDPLLARSYYFIGRSFELRGDLPRIHKALMLALRQSALRHDMETHATLYNILLRMLILNGQVEEAFKLVQKSPFPFNSSGSNQARFHFYEATIQAIQANYPAAKTSLDHALRKAPHGPLSIGFVQTVQKLFVVVQLLLGEIPERSLFMQKSISKALQPYLTLTQAVRLGDLTRFQKIVTNQKEKFAADRTLVLVQRLYQNVLKAGLKRLSRAYVRIPLADVQRKLCLPSVEDTAFVLLKAIKDGVIEGEINHAEGYLQTASVTNPYYTTEPQSAFNERIKAMNSLHDDCLRAMRYPTKVKHSSTTPGNEPAPTEEELMEEYLDAEDDLGF